MSFNLYNKLFFINSFKFLSYSFGSLVENLIETDFKHLRQEFESKLFTKSNKKDFISMNISMILKSVIASFIVH